MSLLSDLTTNLLPNTDDANTRLSSCESDNKLDEEQVLNDGGLIRLKKFLCNLCGKGFAYKHVLKNHEKVHTGERPYCCKLCGKRFKRHDHLQVHKRKHTGERPFSCKTCGRRFKRQHHLKVHNRRHTGERPYGCEFCTATFVQIANYKIHLSSHKQMIFSANYSNNETCSGGFISKNSSAHYSQGKFCFDDPGFKALQTSQYVKLKSGSMSTEINMPHIKNSSIITQFKPLDLSVRR